MKEINLKEVEYKDGSLYITEYFSSLKKGYFKINFDKKSLKELLKYLIDEAL